MSKQFPLINKLATWVIQRETIRVAKEAEAPPPWTKDKVLQHYRFCNVHREDDRVTRWIAKHWREPNKKDPMLWHQMLVARLLNWPPALERIGYSSRWNKKTVLGKLIKMRDNKEKVFTGAYIVSTNGQPVDKVTYIVDVLNVARKEGKIIYPGMELKEAHKRLMSVSGCGSFIAGQVVADLKYAPVLYHALDWWDWAAPGPGSMRGLNRIKKMDITTRWHNPEFSRELIDLRRELLNKKEVSRMISELHLQDLQNCLCETDKYLRLKAGGRTRSNYQTHAGEYTI